MKIVFDSSSLVALLHAGDAMHEDALLIRDLSRTQRGWQIVLPYEVYAESLNVIGRQLGRQAASTAGREILDLAMQGQLDFVYPDASVLNRALMLQLEATGAPSFVDCLVMAYADEYDTETIFGFDATFRKNGYRLPGEDGKGGSGPN